MFCQGVGDSLFVEWLLVNLVVVWVLVVLLGDKGDGVCYYDG